jgi:hypothetical protein
MIDGPPEDRAHAESVEIVRRNDASGSALGPASDGERGARDLVPDEGLDERAVTPEVEEIGPGEIGIFGPAVRGAQGHEPLLVGDHRIGTEEDSFDPAENGGVGTDPESQAEDREKRIAGTALEDAKPESEILAQVIEPKPAPLFPRDLLDEGDVSELAPGPGRGLFGRLAGRHTISLGHRQVRAKLLLELRVAPRATAEPPPGLHDSLSAGGVMIPAIARASCVHFDFSAASWRRPTAVSR